jgi:mitotic spindle assembly checkpoint protein MAD1
LTGEVKELSYARELSEKRLVIAEADATSLRRMLASYEKEADMKAPPVVSVGAGGVGEVGVGSGGGGMDAALRQRNAELEAAAAATAAETASLRAALEDSAAASASARKDLQVVTLRAEAAEGRQTALEREAAALAKELAALEMRVGRGEFDRKQTKVLHMKLNPAAEATQEAAGRELNRVAAENAALRSQLSALEQAAASAAAAAGGVGQATGPSDGGGAVAAAAVAAAGSSRMAVLEAEATVAKQRVADLEKREARYKDIFRQKINTFRDGCLHLFGYRVEMRDAPGGATTFVLRSMYSGEGEQLMFTLSDQGAITIEPTTYSTENAEVKKQVEVFYKRFRSVPGFTANHTMELFNKHTLC